MCIRDRECAAIGKELQIIGDKLLGTRTHAKAAVMFDWDNWWALECLSLIHI